MIQPFNPKHIQRYLLLYVGITLFVILFFVINHFYNPISIHKTKVFENSKQENSVTSKVIKAEEEISTPKFKLLDKAY